MFSHFDTGGLQTAMVRMARWCRVNNVDCLLIFESCDDQMFRLREDFEIDYLQSFEGLDIARAIEDRLVKSDDGVTVVTFELPEFLLFERIRRRHLGGMSLQSVIYNVSDGSMVYGEEFKGIAGKLIRALNKAVFEEMRSSRQTYYMDAETHDAAFERLGLTVAVEDGTVIPLPMFISDESVLPHRHSGERTILTVSRAAFPFKGYLLGLVADFPRLKDRFPDLRLRIVSFGPDIRRLEQTIAECPEPARSSIELVGQSTSEEIRAMLRRSWVYIGMGTTVLDAADEGVPAIVSCHHTLEDVCVGLFCDNPMEIGRAVDGVPGVDLIISIARLSQSGYDELSRKTYEAYRDAYDIEKIMPNILQLEETGRKRIRPLVYTLGYLVFYWLRNLRRRLHHL